MNFQQLTFMLALIALGLSIFAVVVSSGQSSAANQSSAVDLERSREMARLEVGNWLRNGASVVKIERAAAVSHGEPFGARALASAVDGSEGDHFAAEVFAIVESMAGESSTRGDDPRVQQLLDMGRASIPELLRLLNSQDFAGQEQWAARHYMNSVLSQLLDERDAETIVEQFKANGHFANFIEKYELREAEEAIFERVSETWRVLPPIDAMSAAMAFDAQRAGPLLVERVKGERNVSQAFEMLEAADWPGTKQLLLEHADAMRFPPDKTFTVTKLLAWGEAKGIEMAIVLLGDRSLPNFVRDRVAEAVVKHVQVGGSPDEILAFLVKNRSRLKWDSAVAKFVL